MKISLPIVVDSKILAKASDIVRSVVRLGGSSGAYITQEPEIGLALQSDVSFHKMIHKAIEGIEQNPDEVEGVLFSVAATGFDLGLLYAFLLVTKNFQHLLTGQTVKSDGVSPGLERGQFAAQVTTQADLEARAAEALTKAANAGDDAPIDPWIV